MFDFIIEQKKVLQKFFGCCIFLTIAATKRVYNFFSRSDLSAAAEMKELVSHQKNFNKKTFKKKKLAKTKEKKN